MSKKSFIVRLGKHPKLNFNDKDGISFNEFTEQCVGESDSHFETLKNLIDEIDRT